MTEREKLIEIMSHHHSGNIEEARKIADAILKYFTLKTHLREAVGALKSMFNAGQNLLPFKGSIKIYDSIENANELYVSMLKAEQTLSKLKGVLDEENSVN